MLRVFQDVRNKEKALEIAEKLGLTAIDSGKTYHLKKVGAKKQSSKGYPDAFSVIRGHPFLVGEKDAVWLCFFGTGAFDWFKTSPIVSCKEADKYFEIETQNSLYILQK